jgi:hypothetical protein
MSISRYSNEVSIDASLTGGDDWTQVWKNVFFAPPTPTAFSFNRVGFLAGSGIHANRITFSDIDVTTTPISALTLQVITTGPHAGTVQIRNEQNVDFEIEYYEIVSSGSLDANDWTSLDQQEDSDPDLAGWEEAAGNGATLLSEYQLFSATTVAAQSSLSLGQAFDVGANQDLKFYVGLADGTLARGIVEYIDSPQLDGDFTSDGVVDAADYVMWRKLEGANSLLPNDPHGGTIDARQYEIWLENFGRAVSGAGGYVSAAVPEPISAIAMMMGAFALFAAHRQRPSLRSTASRPHSPISLRLSNSSRECPVV